MASGTSDELIAVVDSSSIEHAEAAAESKLPWPDTMAVSSMCAASEDDMTGAILPPRPSHLMPPNAEAPCSAPCMPADR